MLADSVIRNLFGFLPGRKTIDHPVMRSRCDQVAESDVDDLSDFTLGDLPALRHCNTRDIGKNPITGGTGLLHRQLLSLIHISEPTRLLSISYAVFCLKK